MTAIRRAFADLSAGQIHYASCGDVGAPAILLLHQSPRSWLEYRDVLPLLGRRFHAIAMDTAGFGDSVPVAGPVTIEAWAEVAMELLAALSLTGVHVVGHHTGGVIAIEMAASSRGSVRSLVLSSTPWVDEALRRERAARPPIDEVAPSADGSHLQALWQRRQPFYPADRPDLLEAFVVDALRASGGAEVGHRAVAAYRMEEAIGRVRQPVLVVRASADPFASPHSAEWMRRLPQARLVEIDGGMVPLPDQLPTQFAGVVLDFVSGLADGQAAP